MQKVHPTKAWRWTGASYEACDSVPIGDRGFRYGMSLFESLRVVAGRALFLEEHLERLREACWQRDFSIDEAALLAVEKLFEAEEADLFARIYVTGGDGGPGDPPAGCRIYVIAERRERALPAAYRLTLTSEIYSSIFGGLKTANYWPNIDALQHARKKGCDEALLFNENAELVSACMANVFLVQHGRISTPLRACGARHGVVREWVLRTTGARETSLFLRDVHAADEIFVVNSWIGLMPVTAVGELQLSSSVTGDLLRTRYEAEIAGR